VLQALFIEGVKLCVVTALNASAFVRDPRSLMLLSLAAACSVAAAQNLLVHLLPIVFRAIDVPGGEPSLGAGTYMFQTAALRSAIAVPLHMVTGAMMATMAARRRFKGSDWVTTLGVLPLPCFCHGFCVLALSTDDSAGSALLPESVVLPSVLCVLGAGALFAWRQYAMLGIFSFHELHELGSSKNHLHSSCCRCVCDNLGGCLCRRAAAWRDGGESRGVISAGSGMYIPYGEISQQPRVGKTKWRVDL
jgi:hypothetical protein